METDAVLDIKLCGCELPHRAIQFLDAEASGSHSVQEIVPGDLADLISGCWCVKESGEDFQGTLSQGKSGLDVWPCVCGRFWCCSFDFRRVRYAFCFGFDLFVWLSPFRLFFGVSKSGEVFSELIQWFLSLFQLKVSNR
jgi:hypothetical protein